MLLLVLRRAVQTCGEVSCRGSSGVGLHGGCLCCVDADPVGSCGHAFAQLVRDCSRSHHLAGVALGLAGAVIIITRGSGLGFLGGFETGHALAFACSLIWSGYSVLSRRFGAVSTDVVAGFCLVTAFLSAMCHLAFETTVWPSDALQWAAVLGLGLLPVGAAFYTWDYGVKHGDIMVLGASSYASPLLSTLVLVAAGYAPLSWGLAAACVLITAGAVIAAWDMLFKRAPAPT